MALSVASKGAPLASLLKNLLLAAPSSSSVLRHESIAAGRRLFSTGYYYTAPSLYRTGYNYAAPSVYSTGYYYYAAPSLYNNGYYYYAAPYIALPLPSHVLHHRPLLPSHTFYTPAAPARAWWVSKDDVDAVEVTVAMPGLPKECVKAWTNKKGLFVTTDQDIAPYSCHVVLSAGEFDLGKANAEMKHGLLTVTVPRVKEAEIKIE